MIRTFDQGVKLLQDGEIIIYPTETFLAIGCIMTDANAIEKIFTAKGRAMHKPLPLLAASMKQVLEIAQMNTIERVLAETFWPAPLTLLLRAKENVLSSITAGTGKVAVRISAHTVATALSKASQAPLVCSSANISGQAPSQKIEELSRKLFPHVQGIISAGEKPQGGLPSTIIEANAHGKLQILRHGAISVQQLQEKGFDVAV